MIRFAWVIAAILTLALFAGCEVQQISLNSDLKIGSAFPVVDGTDIDGQPISMSQFEGKVVLLDFFGDW